MDDINYMLGRLMERSDSMISTLTDHKREMRKSMTSFDRRLSRIERSKEKAPAIEVWIKRVLTWGMPFATLILTGSWVKFLEALREVAIRGGGL